MQKNKAHCAEHSRRGCGAFHDLPTDGQSLT
nr:MAG TPA: hypothetical protein [Caudoviricetes sp.]